MKAHAKDCDAIIGKGCNCGVDGHADDCVAGLGLGCDCGFDERKRPVTNKFVGVICLNDFPEELTKACNSRAEATQLALDRCMTLSVQSMPNRNTLTPRYFHLRVLELPES